MVILADVLPSNAEQNVKLYAHYLVPNPALFSSNSPIPLILVNANQRPSVAILMGTYNGAQFISEQLRSIVNQSHTHWSLVVSDDGSTDQTPQILAGYQAELGQQKLRVQRGPSAGFSRNFLSLVCAQDIQADYYAFCDQDDIWEVDKLSQALEWLETVPPELPALYGARTRLIDANNQEIGQSPLFTKPPSFGNALVQNIAGGNTMVFNNAARELLRIAGPDLDVPSHDWWAYLVVTACGGSVYYDARPTVRYRQHGGNIIGMNAGLRPKLKRIGMLLNGRFKDFTERNLQALSKLAHRIPPEKQATLVALIAMRMLPFPRWFPSYLKHDLRRQTLTGTMGLILAALLKKI